MFSTDHNVELGNPPSYTQTPNYQTSSNDKTLYNRIFLNANKNINSNSIAFANTSIRLGLFYYWKKNLI